MSGFFGFLRPQYFALGREPVIQGTLADASLVELVGSPGDPFVKIFGRQGRLKSLFGTAWGSTACRPRCPRFHETPPMALIELAGRKARPNHLDCQEAMRMTPLWLSRSDLPSSASKPSGFTLTKRQYNQGSHKPDLCRADRYGRTQGPYPDRSRAAHLRLDGRPLSDLEKQSTFRKSGSSGSEGYQLTDPAP
jgi:hypothetical protein